MGRPEENFARECVTLAMPGVDVQEYDDGSQPSMVDFRLVFKDRPEGIMEITSATDGDSVAFWKLLNGSSDTWIETSLQGGWHVEYKQLPLTKQFCRNFRRDLLSFLTDLERDKVSRVEEPVLAAQAGALQVRAASLSIKSLFQGPTDVPGSIYLHVEPDPDKSGGMVPVSADHLVDWLQDWVNDPSRQDNVKKLEQAGASESHLFIIMPGFSTCSFEVAYLFMMESPPLPTKTPVLPGHITDVWIASTWAAGVGIRWTRGSGWSTFSKPD